MDLPTYTNIWRIEKRLYKLYDFRLPMPLPVGTFGVALGVFALWVVLLSVLNAPFTFGNGWHLVLWVVPPGVITVLATRPVIEGKRLTELLISQARFLTEARVYTRLAPEYEPGQVRVAVRVWHRHPDAGPLPGADRRGTEPVRPAVSLDGLPAGEALGRLPAEAVPPLAEQPEPTVPESGTAPEPVPVPEPVPALVPALAPAAEEPVYAGTAAAPVAARDTGPAADRRGVGRRVLNYFGFALPRASREETEETGPDERSGRRAHGPEGAPPFWSPPPASGGRPADGGAGEGEDERPSEEWLARLRASSGETPVGLSAREAYRVGDTAALSSAELADAVASEDVRADERRRAEEVVSALDPEPDPADPTPARRLRGRVQGIRVARELDERRTGHEPPPREPAEGRGAALPADSPAEPPARRPRPHAAPWELDAPERRTDPSGPGTDDGPYGDLSDYAARFAAATGRPAEEEPAAAPWLLPGAASPGAGASAEAAGPAEAPRDTVRPGEDAPAADAAGTPTAPEVAEPTETAEAAEVPPASETVPELDHGTGEQDALAVLDGGGTGPAADREEERSERLSVLDRHLSRADTPAPPRPAFADAVPAEERGAEDPAWFEDGKRRHPDQPRVGDRGNPVIHASELYEGSTVGPGSDAAGDGAPRGAETAGPDTAGAAGDAAESAKPPTQLDHGTGELSSFVEVREEPAHPVHPDQDRDARSDASAVARRTEQDLEQAEAEALARRRGADREAEGAVRDPRAHPSMANMLAQQRAAEAASREAGRDAAPEPYDSESFHRVARNARRLGDLFGEPVPGEEPVRGTGNRPSASADPGRDSGNGLELDHGTGEQDRLGDAPRGAPSSRPAPSAPGRTEGASDGSGGTRGWRRLAKVVAGSSAPTRSDVSDSDAARLRAPLPGPRSVVVLGCTGGAGQSITALLAGHTLAAHRDDPVVAVDVNPGPNGLSRRVGAQTSETLTALLANAEGIGDRERMDAYTARTGSGLEVVQTLDDPYVQTLDERDYGQLTDLLGRFYGVTFLDPAATGVARALPVADGLVLVAPASADAERAVSMTFEWLDGNGYGALRSNAVLVVNGVSKRSLEAVDAAERVARGRCRAIVRIPWDDHLGSSYSRVDVNALRSATRRAHTALGGVLVSALARPKA
ncbi:TcpE family conjugal transfer membrane protein [Nocardiopsis sp. CNT312]|uniref:TcpE family conjugal transfer membrane protein n=1 Tax=Nocardiopsis sp. CNT312 TaxID=1137268 RepID=UPI0004B27DC6|nr:TcpE family conjugal transfer membrane protein [Nocardiopsis sp. CNT312]